MNVHVTGATGFLGCHVTPLLVRRGHDVSALVRSPTSAEMASKLGARPLDGNLDEPGSVRTAFQASKAEALVNLASLGFGHAPTIVAAARSAGLRRAIFISTTALFTSLNATRKDTRVEAEDIIRQSELDWTIVRPTMIYGAPGDRNMERLLQLLKRVPFLPLPGGGKGLQQPVHIWDLASAIVNALDKSTTYRKEYNVAGPAALSLREVCRQAATAVGKRALFFPIPLGPTIWLSRMPERQGRRPKITSEQLMRLAEDKVFDISSAAHDLDFAPRDFSDGIRQEAALLR